MQSSLFFFFACFLWLVVSQPIQLENLDDFQIAKLLATEPVNSNAGDIIYPTNNTIWHIGEQVNVTFSEKDYGPNETVAIFIFDHTEILAGGSLDQHVFSFVVPASAYTGPHNTALLLAVKRKSLYLQSVDSVVIHVDN
ncbi:hypothetical protein BY458DRAFT_221752 [Sporodiniella umbellata]|nr:hypothetical protein BY458DRAFT_221752 [Sporodiniella umbellata]